MALTINDVVTQSLPPEFNSVVVSSIQTNNNGSAHRISPLDLPTVAVAMRAAMPTGVCTVSLDTLRRDRTCKAQIPSSYRVLLPNWRLTASLVLHTSSRQLWRIAPARADVFYFWRPVITITSQAGVTTRSGTRSRVPSGSNARSARFLRARREVFCPHKTG